MARIHELLAQLRASAPALAADIEREVDVLSDRRAFGLNFERHTPEAVELPGRKVRAGDKVRVQPPRGEMPTVASRVLYRVATIERDGSRRVARIAPLGADFEGAEAGNNWQTVDLHDLVVVAEFRDPIYPGMVSTGKVERGGVKPYHAVINAENFHALQTLLFTHRGRVDAIYIDPPYNTGAKDWKYNNDYVEGDDLYRHSKWLAFMERRLLIAKELLNPDESVLIVTIDEKEYLRLGLLLEQTFPEATVQMVTSVINPRGNARRGQFSRAEEYVFYVLIGDAYVGSWNTDMLRDAPGGNAVQVRWKGLLRSAGNGLRTARPNLFYPLLFDSTTGAFLGAGEPVPLSVDRRSVEAPAGSTLVWPLGNNDREQTWSLGRETLLINHAKGYVKFGPWNGKTRAPSYLTSGQITDLESNGGLLTVLGRDADGALDLQYGDAGRQRQPLTVWNRVSHSATEHGTALNKLLLPDRNFPFPKALYAVEDTLRFLLGDNPDAIVVDFFSGSGTTAHAVMRLNKQDAGRRVSISITNNEVSAEEQKGLRQNGLRPGDPEWEQFGICDYITKPRIRAAITGSTSTGDPIAGDYLFTDIFPMSEGFEENIEFFTLTYEAPMRVQSNREFGRIAPFLWLRAGSRGRRIDELEAGWSVADAYGVLVDLDQTDAFLEAMMAQPDAFVAFIVTDEDRLFQAVVRDLPPGVEPVRMYESYLRNFEIDAMRSVR